MPARFFLPGPDTIRVGAFIWYVERCLDCGHPEYDHRDYCGPEDYRRCLAHDVRYPGHYEPCECNRFLSIRDVADLTAGTGCDE